MIKTIKVIAISLVTIISILLVKFRPAYVVTLNGQEIGYVKDKSTFQKEIENKILVTDETNVAFVALDNVEYKFQFISRELIDEDSTINILKESSTKVYRVYEVADINSNNIVYVNSLEEAENLVNSLQTQYSDVKPDLTITPLYLNNAVTEEAIQEAKNKINEKLNEELEEKKEVESRTVCGVYLACLPTVGNISSRFGSRESIRNHTHKGLDIAAPYGTNVKAVADGTVISAGWNSGGYGNLVVIDHGNGVTTYYGHCSRVCVCEGQKVSAGDVIAKVGSTGNSTGNHLHFEIRINDVQVDPQNYIYN